MLALYIEIIRISILTVKKDSVKEIEGRVSYMRQLRDDYKMVSKQVRKNKSISKKTEGRNLVFPTNQIQLKKDIYCDILSLKACR